MANATMVPTVTEEEIREQASLVVGEYPFKPEVVQNINDYLNIINHTGNNNKKLL